MKRILPIAVVVIAVLQAWDKGLIDWPTPVAAEHEIVAAFRKSLAYDFGVIAIEIDKGKSIQEVDAAIESAFQRAADEADRTISDDIEAIADDDLAGLATLFRDLSEVLE